MDKSRKHYWAVFQGRQVLFEGSFTDCWQHLTERFADRAVSWLSDKGVRIGRLG